ncbi:MAG: hypothetical protein PUC82_03415 [bacterium]|nr:hypothetical protein [bacterium]
MITNINDLKSLTEEDLYNLINSDGNNELKDWLAKVGSDRIDEVFDPSILIERSINIYRNMGYSEEWIKNKINEILKNS